MSREQEDGVLAVDALLDVDLRKVAREVKRLRAIEEWALAQLHVSDGDPVVISEPIAAVGGWAPYREVLVPGRTGTVHGLYLSSYGGTWFGYFAPDDCWSLSEFPPGVSTRYAKVDASFMLRLDWLRRRTDADKPLPVPDGIIPARTSEVRA